MEIRRGKAASPEEQDAPSTWEQLTDINPAGIARSIGEFGKSAWETARSTAELPGSVGVQLGQMVGGASNEETHELWSTPVLNQFVIEEMWDPERTAPEGYSEQQAPEGGLGGLLARDPLGGRQISERLPARTKEQFPLLSAMGTSYRTTGETAVETPAAAFGESGWDETRLGQASEEGRIVPAVIEDVANVASVTGVGSAGARVAGGRVAATQAGKAAREGAQAARAAKPAPKMTAPKATARPATRAARTPPDVGTPQMRPGRRVDRPEPSRPAPPDLTLRQHRDLARTTPALFSRGPARLTARSGEGQPVRTPIREGAGGVERAATRVQRAGEAGEYAATLGARPEGGTAAVWRLPREGVGRATQAAGRRIGGSRGASVARRGEAIQQRGMLGPIARKGMDRVGLTQLGGRLGTGGTGRQVSDMIEGIRGDAQGLAVHVKRFDDAIDEAEAGGRTFDRETARAGALVESGVAETVAPAWRAAQQAGMDSQEFVDDVFLGGTGRQTRMVGATPDVVERAVRVAEGTADPDLARAVGDYRQLYRETLGEANAQQYLTGLQPNVERYDVIDEMGPAAQLTPNRPLGLEVPESRRARLEQFGNEPTSVARRDVEGQVDAEIEGARGRVEQLEDDATAPRRPGEPDAAVRPRQELADANVDQARRRAERLAEERDAKVSRLLDEPDAAPARYRPILETARAAEDAINEHLDQIKRSDMGEAVPPGERIQGDQAREIIERNVRQPVRQIADEIDEPSGAMPARTLSEAVESGIEPGFMPGGPAFQRQLDLADEAIPDELGARIGRVTDEPPESALQTARTVIDADDAARAAREAGDEAVEGPAAAEVRNARLVEGEAVDWMRSEGIGYMHLGEGRSVRVPEELSRSLTREARETARAQGDMPTAGRAPETHQRRENVIPLDPRDQSRIVATRIANETRATTVSRTIDQFSIGTTRDLDISVRGRDLTALMRQRGRREIGEPYVPWDPGNPGGGRIKIDDLDPDTTHWVPASVPPAMKSAFGDTGVGDMVARVVLDKPTDAVKVGWLALNPQWQIGNNTGGFVMSTLASGEPPMAIFRHAPEAARMARQSVNEPERIPGHARRMFNPHPESALGRSISLDTPNPRRARMLSGPIGRGLQRTTGGRVGNVMADEGTMSAAYRLNELGDNFWKSATYLAKRDRGFSPERAVDLALEALPDFRQPWGAYRIFRRGLTFYPWIRHVTKQAWRLPKDHPMRVAWTFNLAEMFEPEGGVADVGFLSGAIPLGGDNYLSAASFTPWANVVPYEAVSDALSGEGPALGPVVRSVNPVLKTGFEMGTGVDPEDMEPISRPPGEEQYVTDTGSTATRPLLTDPRAAAYRLSRITPQTKSITDSALASAYGPMARYESGDPILETRQVPGSDLTWQETIPVEGQEWGWTGASLAGVPTPMFGVDVDEIRRRREEQRERMASQRERYRTGL